MPWVRVDGTDLHVAIHGPPAVGVPTVLFLHGLGSCADDWAAQVPLFSERFRVVAPDLRGHGRSARGPGRLGVARFAADVSRVLATLGERRVHVVGLSLGGCVGLELALSEPHLVRSLTLTNTFAKLAPDGPRGALRMAQRLALLCLAPMPVVAAHVARGLFPKPEQAALYRAAVARLGANPRQTYLASIAALAAFDVRTRLAAVRCPTLVVVGDRDRTVPRAAAGVLGGIPGARVLVVPDSGHATPYDQPDRFNGAVLDFLASVD
jgi:pimeloyl-ACP methyl ester carboxylesterase